MKTKGRRGGIGVCCFCRQTHPLKTLKRMMRDGLKEDALLIVADHDPTTLRRYRPPVEADLAGLIGVEEALAAEPLFGPGVPAVPTEPLSATLSDFIGPAGYGYDKWGQLCNPRQTLGFVKLARIIDAMYRELLAGRVSHDYAAALTGYSAANLVRRVKRSTRGATLQIPEQAVGHIYVNDSGVSHSFDYFETGCGTGPSTWRSLAVFTVRCITKQLARSKGQPAVIQRGSATDLPMSDSYFNAVVTDPPYDAMVNYCDSSDILYVWLKRALVNAHPWFAITNDSGGLQDKTNEAVIKFGSVGNDHRTEAHYKATITKSFDQAKLKTRPDGVISIVFGHGDPDAWSRVLTAITDAGLVLTGSWPCSTEKGGKQTGEYIDNTIMMSTRAAAPNRPDGGQRIVDEQIRAEIARRVPIWTADGLADSDQRMAAIAPAMEIVGRYRQVRDFTGQPMPIEHFLGLAHQAVEEAADIRIDKFRLPDFDERTRFALSWVRQHARKTAAASSARWQRLSYDVTDTDMEGLLVTEKGGSRLAFGNESSTPQLASDSAVIDIALAVAAQGRSLHDIAETLRGIYRENDEMLWAAMATLARTVGEGDQDGQVWTWAVRNRELIVSRAERSRTEQQNLREQDRVRSAQGRLL